MERTANDLVGKFVKVRSDQGRGGDLIGLFFAAGEEDPQCGHVFEFVSRRKVPVATSNCSVIEPWDMVGGLLGLTVRVPDFGEGVVHTECVEGSALVLRVRNPRGQAVRACITSVEVVVPK